MSEHSKVLANDETPSINASNTEKPSKTLTKSFYLACWRWHFYAGLYVIPFLLILAMSGMSMMYLSAFNGRDGENIAVPITGTATGTVVSIAAQEQTITQHFPTATLVEYIQPEINRAAIFHISENISEKDIHTLVALNPYSNDIIDHWVRRDGWYDWLTQLHGTLFMGEIGDRLLEIAAGFGVVLIVTGLYLCWPRTTGWRQVLIPQLRRKGRVQWKSLHQTVGIYIAAFLLLFLLSGLSWTGIWGGKLVQAWNTFPAEKWSNVPLSDKTHASMNHGAIKDVPWGLEQTPLPQSGSNAGLAGLSAEVEATPDSIAQLARALGYQGRFHINYPSDDQGVWTLSQDTMSNDSADPTSDRTVHIDQYTGKILADVSFSDYSLGAKSMAVGIALHEGDMGVWNLVINTIVCLCVIFLCISGIVMWWIRRPIKAFKLAAPPLPEKLPFWKGAVVLILMLSLLFPLVGITLLVVLAIDLLIVQKWPVLARILS